MTGAPEVSVVISARNRAALLFECFQGLAEQTLGRDRFEIVLVDNMTPDPLESVAERGRTELGLTIRYARTTEDRGPAPARNLGVSLARADILATTDSDCRPHPGWLAAGLTIFADPAIAMVSGPCLPKPGQPLRMTSKRHFNEVEHPAFPTMNMFYRRRVFEALGGFDTSLSVRDVLDRAVEIADTDLAWRVIEAGHARRFSPDAIIYHEVEDLGVIGYVLDGTRYFLVPAAVRRHPELRSVLLTARLFLQPSSWMIYVALLVAVVAATAEPWVLALLPAMLLARAIWRTRTLQVGEVAWFCAWACLQLPRNIVITLALLYGSIRYRCLVL